MQYLGLRECATTVPIWLGLDREPGVSAFDGALDEEHLGDRELPRVRDREQ